MICTNKVIINNKTYTTCVAIMNDHNKINNDVFNETQLGLCPL